MVDQEAWQELCDLYLIEQEYAKAAFCLEELILHNPHSHLLHQRLAEIKYTQVLWVKISKLDNLCPRPIYIKYKLNLNIILK